MLAQKLENLRGAGCLQPDLKQPGLLGKEPLPQVLIAAVGKSANEMRDVIILAEFLICLWVKLGVLPNLLKFSFEGQLVLVGVLVYLLLHLRLLGVRIVPTPGHQLDGKTYINSIFRRT